MLQNKNNILIQSKNDGHEQINSSSGFAAMSAFFNACEVGDYTHIEAILAESNTDWGKYQEVSKFI